VGIVLSRGADGVMGPGKRDGDRDIIVEYKGPLRIVQTEYSESWDSPRPGDTITTTWSKPYRIRQGRDPLRDLVLVVDDEGNRVPFEGGSRAEGSGAPIVIETVRIGWYETWWVYDKRASRPEEGLMVIRCISTHLDHRSFRSGVGMGKVIRLDVSPEVLRRIDGKEISLSVIEALPAEGGPCDEGVYGSRTIDPGRAMPAGGFLP